MEQSLNHSEFQQILRGTNIDFVPCLANAAEVGMQLNLSISYSVSSKLAYILEIKPFLGGLVEHCTHVVQMLTHTHPNHS